MARRLQGAKLRERDDGGDDDDKGWSAGQWLRRLRSFLPVDRSGPGLLVLLVWFGQISCEGEMFGQIHGRGFGLVIVHPDVHASSSCSCRGETEQSAQLG
jgi:hypothetical protein